VDIGGNSLFGGRGRTIHGVLCGPVLGGIYNGLYLLGVSSEWIGLVVAAVLLCCCAAVLLCCCAAGSRNHRRPLPPGCALAALIMGSSRPR
jgi:ABC-type xylose transport system permease subunit